jgi:hypothetical protein
MFDTGTLTLGPTEQPEQRENNTVSELKVNCSSSLRKVSLEELVALEMTARYRKAVHVCTHTLDLTCCPVEMGDFFNLRM